MKIEQKKSVLVYLTLHDGNVELLSPLCVRCHLCVSYTPRNEVVGGYTGFTMSIRLSIRL
jgi:hypothetical protein